MWFLLCWAAEEAQSSSDEGVEDEEKESVQTLDPHTAAGSSVEAKTESTTCNSAVCENNQIDYKTSDMECGGEGEFVRVDILRDICLSFEVF